MKTSVKSLAIMIALSIILNGCSVYYKKEVSFNEAYLSKKPVKLVSNEDKKIHLRRIILKDSTYYGVYWHKGEKITFPLSQETCRSLRIKNRAASTVLNVGGSILTLGIAVLIISAVGISSDWGNYKSNYPSYQFKN